MSFDENIFGWAYQKLGKFRPKENKEVKDHWQLRLREMELTISLVLGFSLKIKTSEVPTFSKIDEVYFPPMTHVGSFFVSEFFLWMKLLFHCSAVKDQNFFDQKENNLARNIQESQSEFKSAILALKKTLPALDRRISELSNQIMESENHWAQRWLEYCSPEKFMPRSQVDECIFPSRPLAENSTKTSATNVVGSLKAKSNENRSMKQGLQLDSETDIKRVTLKEGDENPLVHVFEKALTADNYQGGTRRPDGSDEMEDHSNALKELKVDKVIRSREEVHSRVSADIEMESDGDIETPSELIEAHLKYPEWFQSENKFREDWCHLIERTMGEGPSFSPSESNNEFVHRTAAILKSEVEAIFQKARWNNRERDGSDLDLDSVVRSMSEPTSNQSGEGRWFIRRRKLDQDFALLLLLDLSSSTDAWVANRRVLDELRLVIQILSQVFEDTPERIGISSFSSDSRLNCSYTWVKHFTDSWQKSLARLQNVEPRGYTRMGVALRHSEKRLLDFPARKRAILLLTDAKPTDFDRYEGSHGRGDVRKAIDQLDASDIRLLSLVLSSKQERAFVDLFGKNRSHVVKSAQDIGREFTTQFISLME